MTGSASIAAAHGLRNIPLSYDNAEWERSALRLVYSLFPEWESEPGEIKFTRFTDGITNTVSAIAPAIHQ
jgi:ethanolamine kinase